MTRTVRIALAASVAAAVVASAAVLTLAGVMTAPTHGAPVGTYADPRAALLVIDLQEDYTGAGGRQPVPYPHLGPMIGRVNELIAFARGLGMAVVYVRQEFPDRLGYRLVSGGRAVAGTPGAALDARLARASDDVFTKRRPDAFSNPELERFLSANRVDRLYLCGIDGAHCVLATARGGRNRGYRVTLVEDCVGVRPGKRLVSSYVHYLRAKVEFSSLRQMKESDPEMQKLL